MAINSVNSLSSLSKKALAEKQWCDKGSGGLKTAVPNSLTGLTQFSPLLLQPLPAFTLFPVYLSKSYS